MTDPGTGPGLAVMPGRARAADGVTTLDLRTLPGRRCPPWEPGAHIDLQLAPGLIRQYSLCGDPADRVTWRIAVLREPAGRGGSALRARRTAPKARRSEPAGRVTTSRWFPPTATCSSRAASASRLSCRWCRGGQEGRLGPGLRWPDARPWRSALSSARVTGTGSRSGPQDETGLLDLDAHARRAAAGDAGVLLRPEPLLDAVAAHCATWPDGALHVERFAPAAAAGPGRAGAFEVELAQSGLTLTVPPGDVHPGCGRGGRRAGALVVHRGDLRHLRDRRARPAPGPPGHRAAPAERAAGDTMMICVSRSATPRLVLDL